MINDSLNEIVNQCFSLELTILEGEEFRSVVGFDGMYSVSNMGRVKSERRERPNGGFLKERILKPSTTKRGQRCVNLFERNIPKHFEISVLVADAFIKESRDSHNIVVIHKNKIMNDNRLCNLLLGTRSDSCKIDYIIGNTSYGVDKMTATKVQSAKIRKEKFSLYEIDKLIGYVCSRCFNECKLDEFSGTNTFCNNCKAIADGVIDIGKFQKRKDLWVAELQECSKCKVIKKKSEFYYSKHTKHKITAKCTDCFKQPKKAPQP